MEKLLQPGTQRAFRHGKVEKDFLDTDATDGLFLDCYYPELFWMPMLNPNVNLRPASMCQLIASVGYLGHFGMSWDIVSRCRGSKQTLVHGCPLQGKRRCIWQLL